MRQKSKPRKAMATKTHDHIRVSIARPDSFRGLFRRHRKDRGSDATVTIAKGVVVLAADDFDRFEVCMKSGKAPSQTMLDAEQLHRQMRKR